MILFFTIPKPFRGHIGVIQRNAIGSWKRTHAGARIVLFADEEGAAEAAAALEVEHVTEIERNEWGTPLLSDAFRRAETRAHGDVLCFINADIVLLDDFAPAVGRVAARPGAFLVVGESWNTALDESLAFSTGWQSRLRGRAGRKRGADAIDYFAFRRGLYTGMPDFAIGRTAFDNWLIWQARDRGALVVDATPVVRTLHQDHDYSHAGTLAEIRVSPEAVRNQVLAGGKQHFYTRFDATHVLTRIGLVPNLGALFRWREKARRGLYKLRHRDRAGA